MVYEYDVLPMMREFDTTNAGKLVGELNALAREGEWEFVQLIAGSSGGTLMIVRKPLVDPQRPR